MFEKAQCAPAAEELPAAGRFGRRSSKMRGTPRSIGLSNKLDRELEGESRARGLIGKLLKRRSCMASCLSKPDRKRSLENSSIAACWSRRSSGPASALLLYVELDGCGDAGIGGPGIPHLSSSESIRSRYRTGFYCAFCWHIVLGLTVGHVLRYTLAHEGCDPLLVVLSVTAQLQPVRSPSFYFFP